MTEDEIDDFVTGQMEAEKAQAIAEHQDDLDALALQEWEGDPCRACEGKGEYWGPDSLRWLRCQDCNGTGFEPGTAPTTQEEEVENTEQAAGELNVQEQLPDGFVAVKSSHIKAVAFFDGAEGKPSRIEVMFKRVKGPGARWAYHGATQEMFDKMADPNIESVGKFFAANIKGNKALTAVQVQP